MNDEQEPESGQWLVDKILDGPRSKEVTRIVYMTKMNMTGADVFPSNIEDDEESKSPSDTWGETRVEIEFKS